MKQEHRTCLVCDCEKTMPLDAARLSSALGQDIGPVHTQLCRSQLANFENALAAGGEIVVACTQEAPLFQEVADERRQGEHVRFVNIREMAGWSAEAGQATPKIASLLKTAAFQTKPFSGEGVTSSFTACQIAAEVAVEVLRRGDVSREALWDYNVRYFQGQGAKFASMFVQLPAAAELLRREVDYLFHHDIIFSGEDFRQMNLNYENEMGLGQTISMALKLVGGVLSGRFSFASLKRLLGVSSTATKIKALYQRFPDDPTLFQAWVAEVKPLWGET